MSDNDMVWIHSSVELPGGEDEDYFPVSRSEWDAMTPGRQETYLVEVAVVHQNNVAPCGASVVDESEVPDNFKDGAE